MVPGDCFGLAPARGSLIILVMEQEQLVQRLIDQTRGGGIDWQSEGHDTYSARLANGSAIELSYSFAYNYTQDNGMSTYRLQIQNAEGEDEIWEQDWGLLPPLLDAVREFTHRDDSDRGERVRRKLYDDLG
jgi:hypothetical protein